MEGQSHQGPAQGIPGRPEPGRPSTLAPLMPTPAVSGPGYLRRENVCQTQQQKGRLQTWGIAAPRPACMTRPHIGRIGSKHLCEEAEGEDASPVRNRCQTGMCALGSLRGGRDAAVCDLPKSADTPTHSRLLLQSQEALLNQQNGYAGPGWLLISGSGVRAPRRV